MKFEMAKRVDISPLVSPTYTPVGDDKIISEAFWIDDNGKRAERYQVLTFRDGKIIDLQGCRTRREAERFARRH